jgi:hypothetical protein
MIPLQLVDSFLLKLNLGDAILAGFAFGLLAVLPKKSQRLVSLHIITFGLLLIVSPVSLYEIKELSFLVEPVQYKLVGLVLLIVSPVLYYTADK